MPLSESTALCGPKVLAHRLGISIPDAQSLSKWRVGKGTDPTNMALVFRRMKWHSKFVTNFSIESIIEHKLKYGENGVVIVDYFDHLLSTPDGHYVDVLKLDEYGNLVVWNPDFEDTPEFTLPRSWFVGENHSWFDWHIDPPHKFIHKGAVIAWR